MHMHMHMHVPYTNICRHGHGHGPRCLGMGVGVSSRGRLCGHAPFPPPPSRVPLHAAPCQVQKGDLVAGFVNQTASKTAKKIKEAKGGILFVDEAYQLTQNLQRGQSDFSGEAIDEMMKHMLSTGRKSVTFVFAGYKKEMEEFVQYNAGLESRIKYRFHFDDYTVPELVQITNIKINSKGYKMTTDAQSNLGNIIDKGTDPELRSKYNGRLIDNLMQWAAGASLPPVLARSRHMDMRARVRALASHVARACMGEHVYTHLIAGGTFTLALVRPTRQALA